MTTVLKKILFIALKWLLNTSVTLRETASVTVRNYTLVSSGSGQFNTHTRNARDLTMGYARRPSHPYCLTASTSTDSSSIRRSIRRVTQIRHFTKLQCGSCQWNQSLGCSDACERFRTTAVRWRRGIYIADGLLWTKLQFTTSEVLYLMMIFICKRKRWQ